jgi:hypothetical protein
MMRSFVTTLAIVLLAVAASIAGAVQFEEVAFKDRRTAEREGVLSILGLGQVCPESARNLHIRWTPGTEELWLRFDFSFADDYFAVVDSCTAISYADVELPSSDGVEWWGLAEFNLKSLNTYECPVDAKASGALRMFVAVDVNNERVYFWRKEAV